MKRFDIITEADARPIDIGATVELSAGGHVTPLAQDTLRGAAGHGRAGRIGRLRRCRPTWRPRRRSGAWRSAATTPASSLKRAHRRSTCAGGASPSTIWARTGRRRSTIRTWPAAWRGSVARGEADAGIVIDGAGIGSAIAANKVRGDPGGDVHRRDDRPLRARAQRRERDDARVDAARRTRRGDPARRRLAGHGDDAKRGTFGGC